MDHLRQIRFVIGPFFFLSSLLSAGILACSIRLDVLRELSGGGAAVLIAVAGASVLPLGFVIGGITIFVAQAWFTFRGHGALEFSVADNARILIWTTLSAGDPPPERSDDMYGGTVYELEKFHPEVRQWIDRRWNAFHASANSCVGLVAAPILSRFLFNLTAVDWIVYIGVTAVLVVLLFIMARRAWRQTMKMIEFQSSRIVDGQMPDGGRVPIPAKKWKKSSSGR